MRTTHVATAPSPLPTRSQQRRAVVALIVALIALVIALVLVVANGSKSLADIAGGTGQSVGLGTSADDGSVLTPEHGYIGQGEGLSVFDDQAPAVTRLNPALLDALRRAATDAAVSGVEFEVNSGWRSPEYQSSLLRAAVDDYGSEEEAARWVATAHTSAHVSGDAVDIGPLTATDWLAQHGAQYGLCQIYGNESWHYELRPDAVGGVCPPAYADPTEDPRMQG
ncbi:M15 family metallopeptidase [Microbacterium murale]|uniref:D-alanyl-D-alanine carboxypeptidase n=1 Tax=Microbacterium murale TaxID=1081040 RepID=A0ABU0PBA9_9MICO|nr:M15 family metallopeptidase [Microbacterium murale]MDQ0643869.1 D-alanyl-D-alanine carboxypeptidase [Microbacterium murale]